MNRQEWRGRPHRKGPPRFPWWWILLLSASAVLQVSGLIGIFSRQAQDDAARRAAADLRAVYQKAADVPTISPAPTEVFTVLPAATAKPEAGPAGTPEAIMTPASLPTPTPIPRLEEITYPANPERKVDSRFQALKKENRDIIGWLTVGKIVDEPVVQRDNVFYMDHDVKGKSNINGAIFLDENVSLRTRPSGMILYGHNMRDGGMFGRLRNYEKAGFYHGNPILTFDTAYEDGRYVIFATGIVNVENENSERFLDFFGVTTRNIHERERAIATLKEITPYDCGVDVQAEDQLLLLVTCVGKDEERRVVAARRIREGESEETLKSQDSARTLNAAEGNGR